jgi:fermentation-respiration switch protein FrsA (DUF1100 family)
MQFLKGVLIVVAVIYLLLLLALYTFQRSVLYIPPSVYLTPDAVELNGAEEIYNLETDGELLGWWLPPTEPSHPTVIYFHGNGSAVFSANDIYRTLNANGYGVFAVAYPGYPGRLGKPTQESLVHAAAQGYDYLISQGVAPKTIVLYGTSLGAGVAAQLATQRDAAVIIMEAPFTSAADMAQLSFPIFPARALTKDTFYSDRALSGLDIPLVWMHGTNDHVIPLSLGQKLYSDYGGPKSAHILAGAEHNNVWYRGGDKIVLEALERLSATESAR